ncbi:MAG: hypothetical protein WCF36_14885 [Candidatus Nanopelagicales bacterium]
MRTAVFDTRGSHPKAVVAFDRASSQIEKALVALGGLPVAPAEHFLVAGVPAPSSRVNWTGPARGGAPWPRA